MLIVHLRRWGPVSVSVGVRVVLRVVLHLGEVSSWLAVAVGDVHLAHLLLHMPLI